MSSQRHDDASGLDDTSEPLVDAIYRGSVKAEPPFIVKLNYFVDMLVRGPSPHGLTTVSKHLSDFGPIKYFNRHLANASPAYRLWLSAGVPIAKLWKDEPQLLQ